MAQERGGAFHIRREFSSVRGIYMEDPAPEADLTRLQEYALKKFGCSLPPDYISFLRQSNGMQLENALFMTAADVVPMNADSPLAGRVRIGSAGNIDDFAFDIRTRTFVVARLGCPGEVHCSYVSFLELLQSVAKQQGVGANA